jgi:hypothetical protein
MDICRNSAVGIATGYGLDNREVGVRVPVGSRIFTSPYRPDRLWGPPNRRLFPGVEADHSPPASASQENMDLYIHSPIRLNGVVLNSLNTGTPLPYIYTYHTTKSEAVFPFYNLNIQHLRLCLFSDLSEADFRLFLYEFRMSRPLSCP